MIDIIQNLHKEIEKPNLDRTSFLKILTEYYGKFFTLNADASKIYVEPQAVLEQILQRSFESRLKINKKLSTYILNLRKEDEELFAHVSDMNRALRYLEDYVLEIAMKDKEPQKHKFTTLQGEAPYFTIAPGHKLDSIEDLKSGDMLLTRGGAYSSAAIARIGVNDAQFSHLSFVYRNPKDGKLYTVEAHIEIGSVVNPIDVHIKGKNSRTVVYRFEDGELAHKAAEYMYHKVKKESDKGYNIEYNFTMQVENNDRLFCSQVIYEGFRQASNQTLDLPQFKTKFNAGLISFLNRLGIPLNLENVADLTTFSPGDIEYDPRFTLIAEWKDPNQLQDSRFKDAILTKMFAWMDEENYHIKEPTGVKIKSGIAYLLRRTPFLKNLVTEMLPLNMNTGQLNLILTMDKIGGVLMEEVQNENAKREKPLSIKEIFEILETFKEQDKKSPTPRFHQWFNQKE